MMRRVRRILGDPASVGLWLVLTLAGLVAAFVVGHTVWALGVGR
jgi:hypothetical protein